MACIPTMPVRFLFGIKKNQNITLKRRNSVFSNYLNPISEYSPQEIKRQFKHLSQLIRKSSSLFGRRNNYESSQFH